MVVGFPTFTPIFRSITPTNCFAHFSMVSVWSLGSARVISDDAVGTANPANPANPVACFDDGFFPDSGASMFSSMHMGGTGTGGDGVFSSSFSSSMGSGGGGAGSFSQVNVATSYVNGRKVTRKTSMQNGVKTEEVYENDELVQQLVNGVEQQVNTQRIRGRRE
eukprot:347971_1